MAFFLFLAAGLSFGSSHRRQELRILDEFLQNRTLHDKRVPPLDDENETVVSTRITISNLWDLNQKTMDCQADVYIFLSWLVPELKQSRLKNDNLHLTEPGMVRKFWKPEITFPNSKNSKVYDSLVPNHNLIIHDTSRMQYRFRANLKFSCVMDLHDFPFDHQECRIDVGFISRPQGRLEWMRPNNETASPVYIRPDIILPQFHIVNYFAVQCLGDQVRVSNSCLSAVIRFKRRLGYHIVNTYLPTMLTVVVSWLTFWMDVYSEPGRTALGVTTLLIVTSKASAVQSSVAEVSYVKAIDVWMGACTSFVFAAFVEFVVANYRSRHCVKELDKRRASSTDVEGRITRPKSMVQKTWDMIRSRSVDQNARFLFPLGFIAFNIGYWVYFMTVVKKSTIRYSEIPQYDL